MMITTARIYIIGASALAFMVSFGLYRQTHYSPIAHGQQISASAPALTQAASMPVAATATIPDEISEKRKAIAANPDDLDGQAELAYMLISKENPTAEVVQEATKLIENACRKTQFKERKYIDTLGRIYAVAGKYDKAIQVGEIVRMMAENAKDNEATAAAEVRLEIYRSLQLKQKIDEDMKATSQPATQPK